MSFDDSKKDEAENKAMANILVGGLRRLNGAMTAERAEGKMPSVPEKLRSDILNIPEDMIARAGPEMQSLWEFRDNPELFNMQLRELEQNGSMDLLEADYVSLMSEIDAMPAPVPAMDLTVASPTLRVDTPAPVLS